MKKNKFNLLQPKLYDAKDDNTKTDILGYIAEDVAQLNTLFATYNDYQDPSSIVAINYNNIYSTLDILSGNVFGCKNIPKNDKNSE